MEPSNLYRWNLHDGRDEAVDRRSNDGRDDVPGGVATSAETPAGARDEVPDVLGADGLDPAPTTDAVGRAPIERVQVGESDVTSRPTPATLDDVRAPVLVHAMRGGMDAGSAGSLVATHLLAGHPSTRVATFDIDELMDYRSRRPTMTFSSPSYTEYADPVLALDHVATPQGGLLLLHGPEPDLRWESFTLAVREIVERLGVTTTVGVHGIPMGVPHTRPLGVTAHGTREGLIDPQADIFGTVQIPGSASALVEYRLGQWGHDAMGFAVHVPHYLAQASYPAAAGELIRQISRVTGEELDTAALDEAAATVAEEITTQIEDSPDVSALVQALETQYDAYQEASGRSLLARGDVPSAEELGAQFEAFLAEQASNDADGENGGDDGRRPPG